MTERVTLVSSQRGLFIGGRFSHAVRRDPLLHRREGVRQDRDSRGGLARVQPTTAQRHVAESVLDVIGTLLPDTAAPLSARIDVVRDGAGRPVVLELELTEPNVFLPQAPEAAASLLRAVEAHLSR